MSRAAEKARKELERRFGDLAKDLEGYHHHIDFRSHDNFTDECFAYLMENVRGVNMLDLNETDITNQSISLLTKLEYVNEIRAKGCCNLDDGCIADLNKIESITFLHLKSTNITIDGVLKLNSLSHLTTLMFSAEDVGAINEKLLELKVMHPGCEFVIDSKPHYTNAIDLLIHALKRIPVTFRLKIKNQVITEIWSAWIRKVDEHSIEVENQGTYAINDVEWMEIDPATKAIDAFKNTSDDYDHTKVIATLLENLTFPFQVIDGVFCLYLLDIEI